MLEFAASTPPRPAFAGRPSLEKEGFVRGCKTTFLKHYFRYYYWVNTGKILPKHLKKGGSTSECWTGWCSQVKDRIELWVMGSFSKEGRPANAGRGGVEAANSSTLTDFRTPSIIKKNLCIMRSLGKGGFWGALPKSLLVDSY